MTKTFTRNDLIRYIYQETTKKKKQEIEQELLLDKQSIRDKTTRLIASQQYTQDIKTIVRSKLNTGQQDLMLDQKSPQDKATQLVISAIISGPQVLFLDLQSI